MDESSSIHFRRIRIRQSLESPYICIASYSSRTGRLYIVKAFSRAINTQLTECDEVGYDYCTYDLSRAIISSNSKGTRCALSHAK